MAVLVTDNLLQWPGGTVTKVMVGCVIVNCFCSLAPIVTVLSELPENALGLHADGDNDGDASARGSSGGSGGGSLHDKKELLFSPRRRGAGSDDAHEPLLFGDAGTGPRGSGGMMLDVDMDASDPTRASTSPKESWAA